MCYDFHALEKEKDYNFLHVLYYQRECDFPNHSFDFKKYIDHSLKKYNLSKIETTQYIIDMMQEVFQHRIYSDFFQYVFLILSKENNNSTVEEKGYIHKRYNEYCLNRREKIIKDKKGGI